jgi:hypothetical protein
MDRRQSRFNPGGSDSIRRRNSIVGRRLSNSFDSRKSSSQDAAINRIEQNRIKMKFFNRLDLNLKYVKY